LRSKRLSRVNWKRLQTGLIEKLLWWCHISTKQVLLCFGVWMAIRMVRYCVQLVVGSWQTAASRNERGCSSSADDAEKTRLRRAQLHYSTHPSSLQASLAKGGVIEARLRSWMFDTAFQRLQIKTVCAVAPQECKLWRIYRTCLSRLQPPIGPPYSPAHPQRFKSSS
jgi:hypothetical protein